ncbi:MAG: type II toxin-antitoxin system RelE/ParE family toxin [Oculatellaceae cyanobacterium bins.114]|nr:type II toxin-antitoxin system RelE/ParE family toxin [Oculatellaceae cyanobacterium bins.114]
MTRYRLSRRAEQDLEDIWIYLAQSDELTADLMLGKILDKLPMLAKFPNMGKLRSGLMEGLRSFPIKPYIVFYILSQNHIEIVRIFHHSRDIKSEF